MDAFDFRKLCADVTHPRPLSRGEILGAAFLLVMSGLSVFISPLQRGGLECCFLVGNEWFEWGCFPSREGRFEMLFSY